MKNKWHNAYTTEDMTDFIIQQLAEDIEPQELISHINSVSYIVFSPDSSKFISGSLYDKDKTCSNLFMWDTKTGKRLLKLKVNPEEIRQVSFSPDGSQVLTSCASDQNNLVTWDSYTGAMIFNFIPDDSHASFGVFTPDGQKIISVDSSSSESDINIWNAHTGKKILNIHYKDQNGCNISQAILSPNGMKIAAFCIGGEYRDITIIDANTGMSLCKINNFTHNISTLAFSPDSTKIVSGNRDELSNINIWDAQTGEKLVTIEGHPFSRAEYDSFHIRSVKFSPNGKYIASISDKERNNFILWNAHSGKKIFDLTFHPHVHKTIFTPDSNYIISFNFEEEIGIIVWDINTGKKLFNLTNYPQHASSAALSPDGTTLVAGGYSKQNNLFIWKVPFDLITTIKNDLNKKQIELLYNHYRMPENRIDFTLTSDSPDYATYQSLPDSVKKAMHQKNKHTFYELEHWACSIYYRLEIIINRTREKQRLSCRRKILSAQRTISNLIRKRKNKLEFLKLALATPPYTGSSYKDASNIEMGILDCFIAHDCYGGTLSAKEWALNDEWESGGGNITFWEKEDGYILITDMYSEEELPTVLKMSHDQFIKLLDDWEEKVHKLQPQEVTITYYNDEFIIETKN